LKQDHFAGSNTKPPQTLWIVRQQPLSKCARCIPN